MQLSQESYRTRWIVLVGVWTAIALSLIGQARVVHNYLGLANELGTRGAPLTTPLQQPFPAFAADAQVWVRHALALLEGHDVRLRQTTIDNAPKGREVHWNSAWAWTIAGAGKVHQLFTGLPITTSVERATVWLTPLVMFSLIVTLSAWATRHAGLIAGVLVAAAMACHDRIFEGFFPSYVDHHGLLTVSVLGMVFGAVCMGGGWWQKNDGAAAPMLPETPERARKAAGFSALCGACGIWVSAASTIPPIAIVGISGLLAGLFFGRDAQRQGSKFDPQTWRHWGRTGAVASFVFYLIEYFPNHLSFRLEPNHPFHALAWFGAGELIAALVERSLLPPKERWANLKSLALPFAAVLPAPITMIVGGAKVLAFRDPFMASLHYDYIQEFLPLWRTLRAFDAKGVFQIIGIANLPLILGLATLSFRRGHNTIVLWFATLAAIFFTVMAWAQSRWLLNATGIQISLTLLVLAIWSARWRVQTRWIVAGALIAVVYLPSLYFRFTGASGDVANRRIAPKDAQSALNRDIAAALRASQPEGPITLLSSPNSSTGIGYYGRFQTVGTLYWENTEGLKAAASVFAAKTEDEAAKRIKELGITHIAIISDENFIEQYYRLLNPAATTEEVRKCFGLKIMLDRAVPQWLQMLPYRIPDDLSSLKYTVMLFKVNFSQNYFEAVYNLALAQVAQGQVDDAERTLDSLIKQIPDAYQPWLRKGELMMARRDFEGARDHLIRGLTLAPAAEKYAICTGTAKAFYTQGRPAEAVQIYRAALKDQFHPDLAAYLAWILSTSSVDALRNGQEALELAQAALKSNPTSATFLNATAAAYAELGRFPEAIAIMEQALASARLRKEADLARDSEQRIAQFQAGKPIRK